MPTDISSFAAKAAAFRDARNWKQFHHPKDMAIALSLEAAEVLEHFQWKSEAEVHAYLSEHLSELADELADVLYWTVLMAHDLDIDLSQAFEAKMRKNDEKYPVEKSLGRHTKYNKLS